MKNKTFTNTANVPKSNNSNTISGQSSPSILPYPKLKKHYSDTEYSEENIVKAIKAANDLQHLLDKTEEMGETATQTISRYMDSENWKSHNFTNRTQLNADTYRKIKRNPHYKLELPIIVSICIGLRLPKELSLNIISKAGYALGTSVQDRAYEKIISGDATYNISACNDFIKQVKKNNPTCKIRLLGSQDYENQNKEK